MREILFRGKRKDNGEWVEGNLFIPDLPNKPTQICMGTNVVRITFDVDPETVGQFTGLTDKNGTNIFEGDVVKNHLGIKQLVIFENGCFFFIEPIDYIYGERQGENFYACDKKYKDFEMCITEDEVIGNIHDNPEWVRKEEDI